jgi:hypothetical protein
MVTKREVTYSPRPWGVRHRGKAGETTASPASTPGGPHFALAHDNENRLAEAQQNQDPGHCFPPQSGGDEGSDGELVEDLRGGDVSPTQMRKLLGACGGREGSRT